VHQRYGPAEAPVKLVEFTDILCSHCRALIATLEELKKAVPPENLSIEPRYFPLDSECNKKVSISKGDGVRCLGAKAQICLEGTADYWKLREEMFENQNALSKEMILAIAGKALTKEKLQACLDAPETQARIDEDVAYAMLFKPTGTPIVVLNGRETLPVPAFLYGMMLSKGDPQTKYFAKLPPPR
jgi:protein-disulfide isomerase